MAQGWRLRGDRIPVLYTDTINGECVGRDDLWLCTTEALTTSQGDALDMARLDWLLGDGRHMAIDAFCGNYRVVDVSCNLVITDWMPTQRAAIDAAITAQKGK